VILRKFLEKLGLTGAGSARILRPEAHAGLGFCRWWQFWVRLKVADDGHTALGVLTPSLPVPSNGAGAYEIVQDLHFRDWAKGKIKATNDELLAEREVVKDLLKD